VIRDVTETRRLADLAQAAVTAKQAHDSQELLGPITTSLFDVGRSLQAAAGLPHDAASKSIAEAAARRVGEEGERLPAMTARGGPSGTFAPAAAKHGHPSIGL
jgi:hypothetical protein